MMKRLRLMKGNSLAVGYGRRSYACVAAFAGP